MAQADCIHQHLWHQRQSQLRPVLPWNYPYPYTAFYRASENLSPQHMTEHISQYCHSILHTMPHPHNRIWQESSHSTQPHTVDHPQSSSYLIKKFLNTPSNNTNAITDNMLIPFDISGLWFPLGSLSTTEKVNALSQWNDSWLMTVLKQIYYTEYYRNRDLKPNSDEYILKQSLSELLRNKKCYYSLIKRSENFKIIDDEVRNILLKNKEEICNLETKINDLSKKFEDCESTNTITVDMKGSLDFIDQILKDISKTSKRFILSIIKKNCSAIKIKSFEDFVKEIVTAEINDFFYNDEKYNSITVFKNISIGLDQPIYFYNYDGHICTLDEISGISDILQLDLDYFPVFYIYLVVEDGEDIIKQRRVNILQRIGAKLGEKIKTQIISELTESIKQMEE